MQKNKKLNAKRGNSIASNALSNWVTLFVNLFITLIITRLLIKEIGEEAYGAWALVISFVGYYGVLDLGIRHAATTFVARSRGQNNQSSINESFSTVVIFFAGLGLIVIIFSLILSPLLVSLLFKNKEVSWNLHTLIKLIGLFVAISFIINGMVAFLLAHELFVISNFIRIIILIIRSLMVVFSIIMYRSLVLVAVSYVATSIIELIIVVIVVITKTPKTQFSFSMFSWNRLVAFGKYGAKATILVLADQLRFNIDVLIITRWINLSAVALYRIASSIVQYAIKIVIGANNVFQPRFAYLLGKNDNESLKQSFLDSIALSSVLGVAASISLIIIGGTIVRIWVGPDFYESVPLIWIFALVYVGEMIQTPTVNLMYAKNKHGLYAVVNIIEGVCNLIISILLVRQYGLLGVALGTAIPMVFVKVFIQPLIAVKVSGVLFSSYILRLLIPLCVGIILVLLSYLSGIITNWDDFNLLMAVGLFLFALITHLSVSLVVMHCTKIFTFSKFCSFFKPITSIT